MVRFHASRIVWMAVLAVAAGLPAAAAAAEAAATYTVTDMGSLGLGESDGYGINATGQVTGLSYLPATYTYSAVTPSGRARPIPTTRFCTATAR
jgi:hypothetical protein